jgi:2-iminobutanoate/2-iminopropanoate deaminase
MSMSIKVIVVGAALLAPVAGVAADSGRSFIVGQRSAARAPLPFSDAVVAGSTLYVAGHIGLDPKTDRAAENPATEARLVMDAVKQTVEAAGYNMDDLVTVQVFCTDLGLYDTFNDVYRTYFRGHYPARAFIGAAKLLRGAHYEVLGIAAKSAP